VLSVELLRRAKLKGYAGGKSARALYALVKELRPERPRPVVRFEGLPGEFSQHDFGHVDVRCLDGRKQRVHFFVSRLKYSRWVQVSLVANEQVEALVRTMVEHLRRGVVCRIGAGQDWIHSRRYRGSTRAIRVAVHRVHRSPDGRQHVGSGVAGSVAFRDSCCVELSRSS
jgi:hypothetical protein